MLYVDELNGASCPRVAAALSLVMFFQAPIWVGCPSSVKSTIGALKHVAIKIGHVVIIRMATGGAKSGCGAIEKRPGFIPGVSTRCSFFGLASTSSQTKQPFNDTWALYLGCDPQLF
jgi:hypothetical protein